MASHRWGCGCHNCHKQDRAADFDFREQTDEVFALPGTSPEERAAAKKAAEEDIAWSRFERWELREVEVDMAWGLHIEGDFESSADWWDFDRECDLIEREWERQAYFEYAA